MREEGGEERNSGGGGGEGLRDEWGCCCCGGGHGGGCRRCGEDRRLGEVDHVLGVTFILLIVGRGLEVDRGTQVVGEALNMEQAKALFTCLFVFCTTVNLSITQGAPDIYR